MREQNPVFIPGPTNIPELLRHAMNVPTSDHRSPDFQRLLLPLLEDLKQVFKTVNGQVLVFPGSGTGGWEAALANTLSAGDRVLVASYGMFSQRWITMCRQLGLQPEVIECEWGSAAPAEAFAEMLAADDNHEFKALLVTHNETATGVRSDIGAVREALDRSGHPALLLVDCVSSLASMDFRMDDWGVDVAITGSQKGFMLATGLAIVGLSRKAQAAASEAGLARSYFDFNDMLNATRGGGYPYTPSLPLIHGLRASVDLLLDEGLDRVFARHFRIAEGVRRAVQAWELRLCAHSADNFSDTVSAIYVPEGYDSDVLVNHAYAAYGVSYGIGLGQMSGRAFRIGHLGSMTDVMALSGLAAIEMAMTDLDYPISLGSGVAAAQDYYRNSRDD